VKRSPIKTNALSYSKLIAALVNDSPLTVTELQIPTGLHYGTIREQLRALHKERLIFIAGYKKDARDRDNEHLWSWGNQKDVKKFKLSPSQRQARAREKKRLAQIQEVMLCTLKLSTLTELNRGFSEKSSADLLTTST
jgi:hypothetical protein